jgi:hypothetical protein
MAWEVAQVAIYWVIGWVVMKFAHMILSTLLLKDWSIGNGIGVLIIQGAIDIMIALGLLFAIGAAVCSLFA